MSHKPWISPNMTTSFTPTPYSKLFHCVLFIYHQNLSSLISSTLFSSFPSPFFFNWNLVILENIDYFLVLSISGYFYLPSFCFIVPSSSHVSLSSQKTWASEVHRPFLGIYQPPPHSLKSWASRSLFIFVDFNVHEDDHAWDLDLTFPGPTLVHAIPQTLNY